MTPARLAQMTGIKAKIIEAFLNRRNSLSRLPNSASAFLRWQAEHKTCT
jgi:hypothetical protein